MVNVQTVLKIVDNSGGRFGQCIRVLSKAAKKPATIGDTIILSVKRATPNKKIKKSTVQRGVIVRSAKNFLRFDGSRIRFDQTTMVLLNKMAMPLGTRVFGPVCKELRDRKFIKILSLATLSI